MSATATEALPRYVPGAYQRPDTDEPTFGEVMDDPDSYPVEYAREAKMAKAVMLAAGRSRFREQENRCHSAAAVPRRARARSSRGSATRTRGSRRGSSSRSSGGGSSGSDSDLADESDGEPPGLPLWRRDDYGHVTPNPYRLLLGEGRS